MGTFGTAKHVGPSHPMHFDQLHSFGGILARKGQLREAEEVLQEAWKGRQTALGDDHPQTHCTLRELAEVVRRSGRAHEAELLLQQQRCHGLSCRHPTAGNAALVTAASNTHRTFRGDRSRSGAPYPTRGPSGDLHVGVKADVDAWRRSRSMREGMAMTRTAQGSVGMSRSMSSAGFQVITSWKASPTHRATFAVDL